MPWNGFVAGMRERPHGLPQTTQGYGLDLNYNGRYSFIARHDQTDLGRPGLQFMIRLAPRTT